jgi:hypothetical protein
MLRRLAAAVVVVLLAAASPARAWSDLGHMTIAAAAYDLLSPPVRARVDALMRRHPDYDRWTADRPEAERARIAFVHAATWPDDIKKDPAWRKDPIEESGADANIGFGDRRMHHYWHFAGFPWSTDGTPGKPPREPDALERLGVFRRALASDVPDDLAAYDLTWTIHLIGDVHQPAHTTTRYSKGLPKGDAIATRELVVVDGKVKKLHAFWDGLLGGRGTPEQAIAIARSRASLQGLGAAPAADLDPARWFEEGEALARRWIYTAEIGDGTGPFPLSDDYRRAARAVAERQAAVAASRLAGFLEAALARH